MICRLCLKALSKEIAVELFETTESNAETELIKMIAKYFLLELTHYDPISTHICQDCCEHLEDFHRFWTLVSKKQSTLGNEFLEIKCDVELSAVVEEEENDILSAENDDVSLMELKYVPIVEWSEHEELALHKNELEQINKKNYTTDDLRPADNASMTDDDVPLVTLKTKANFKALNKTKDKYCVNTTKQIKTEQFDIDIEDNNIKDLVLDDTTGKDKVINDDPLLSLKSKSRIKIKSTKEIAKSKKRKSTKKRRLKLKQTDDFATTEEEEEQNETLTNDKTVKKSKQTPWDKIQRNREIISNFMTLSCDLCENQTTIEDFSELRIHFQTVHHTDSAYIKCCGKKFERANCLVDHITWHTNPDCFKCDICNKQLRNSKSLKLHKSTQHPKKLLEGVISPCHLCNKVFRSAKCLENHLKRHDSEKKEYICEICNKCFMSKNSLRIHIRCVHENICHHVCETCGKKYKCKTTFEKHVLEHQGIVDPPVQCKVCNVWMRNSERLRFHMLSHDVRDSKCKFCGRLCPSRPALRKHINYWHKPQKIYQCKYCEKSFKASSSFEEHVAIHTGQQLYSCPHCSKECRSRANMYVHIKRIHHAEWLQSQIARSHNPYKAAEDAQ